MHIEELNCERCNGRNDVKSVRIDDEVKNYCLNCREELFSKKKSVGRPSVGVTKKVSLTLDEKHWKWLDENAEGNRSKFLRDKLTYEEAASLTEEELLSLSDEEFTIVKDIIAKELSRVQGVYDLLKGKELNIK